jgi:hypothetical protein
MSYSIVIVAGCDSLSAVTRDRRVNDRCVFIDFNRSLPFDLSWIIKAKRSGPGNETT